MKVHHLQHVSFEDLGSMESYFVEQGHSLSSTHLYKNESLPNPNDFDFLIVMGGPMGIFDEEQYPWLIQEKAFIKTCIDLGKPILGICLGAQLLAHLLGEKVYPGKQKEIGWWPIQKLEESSETPFGKIFPQEATVFHWHGDTFDLPKNAVALAQSSVTANQGFYWNKQVIALQFHLETTPESAKNLIFNGREELVDAPYIQSAEDMQRVEQPFNMINQLMSNLLTELGL